MASSVHYDKLATELSAFKTLSSMSGFNGFFGSEVLRFYTVSGTLMSVDSFALDQSANPEERQITHILMRSLLENYFTILYLTDDPSQTGTRYDQLKVSFQSDYAKLMNELSQTPWNAFFGTYRVNLPPSRPGWNTKVGGLPDVRSMLTGLKNYHGNSLDFLYVLYRVSSFDTHGRSFASVFRDVFGQNASFLVLRILQAIDLIANEYLVILQTVRSQGVTV